jgi:hypothetical protein
MQVLCNFLYDNQIEGKVNENIWDVSLNMTISHLGDVLFDYLYDSASPSEKEILRVLAEEHGPLGNKMIAARAKKFKSEAVNKYLNRLVLKKLVVKTERGIFDLPDRMFREYVLQRY